MKHKFREIGYVEQNRKARLQARCFIFGCVWIAFYGRDIVGRRYSIERVWLDINNRDNTYHNMADGINRCSITAYAKTASV
jgi:hypothetical protein